MAILLDERDEGSAIFPLKADFCDVACAILGNMGNVISKVIALGLHRPAQHSSLLFDRKRYRA